jgi:hypothetical protein
VPVRLEGAVGITAAPHIDVHARVTGLGEPGTALRLALAGLAVRGADHDHRCGQLPGQHQVGRQRDAIVQRDPDVEPADHSSLGHDRRCYPAAVTRLDHFRPPGTGRTCQWPR